MDESTKKKKVFQAFKTALIALIVCVLFHMFLYACHSVGQYIQDFREFNSFRYDRQDDGPAPNPFDGRRRDRNESLYDLVIRVLPPNANADQIRMIAAALNVIAGRIDKGKIHGKTDAIGEINRRIKGKASPEWVNFFETLKDRAESDCVDGKDALASFLRDTADALMRASRTLKDETIDEDSDEQQDGVESQEE